jgi:hypothetical protein
MMAISHVSTAAQAVASYTAQMQTVQQNHRPPQHDPKAQEQAKRKQGGDQVTLSAQSTQTANQTKELQTKRTNELAGASNAQTVEQKQRSSPQATHAAASKSVTQALEAYVQASLV